MKDGAKLLFNIDGSSDPIGAGSSITITRDLPGLFQYVDETGATVAIEAGDVNAYLRETAGAEFSTKDFRTWAGTLIAAHALRGCADCQSKGRNDEQPGAKIAPYVCLLQNRHASTAGILVLGRGYVRKKSIPGKSSNQEWHGSCANEIVTETRR